ncbi:NifB/NifX family molybdenum-iron cluster-binding protein [Palaeococcus ferrophilus]|uniref:NifB/NifX family molybdenum-iron cluster-binding protein n=1 Tax=Palaeococcus ferrophilus TaxID=83868 RepID=UPI00064E361E|nr:NifB/NifX family molybdenum-iron cluster-binding protein [Palaeococcus ferrophilus]
MRVAIPTGVGGLRDVVHESLVRAKTFTLVELENGKTKRVEVVENPYSTLPHGAGPKVALFLVNLGVDVLITRMDCPKGKMILDSGNVRIIKIDGGMTVEKALSIPTLRE